VTDCTRRCVGTDASGTGLPLDLPTGSGFYAMQPSLTWLYASDPAILFGGVSYLYNFKRNNVSRRVLAGELEPLGTVAPGGVIGFNFGLGLALNEQGADQLRLRPQFDCAHAAEWLAGAGLGAHPAGHAADGLSYRISANAASTWRSAPASRAIRRCSAIVRLPISFSTGKHSI
jgi:hypothetical protein